MAKSSSLTYGQLYNKLKKLGFEEYRVELNGKRGRVFERSDLHASMITLPEQGADIPVEPFDREKVQLILKRLDLLPECDPLAALPE